MIKVLVVVLLMAGLGHTADSGSSCDVDLRRAHILRVYPETFPISIVSLNDERLESVRVPLVPHRGFCAVSNAAQQAGLELEVILQRHVVKRPVDWEIELLFGVGRDHADKVMAVTLPFLTYNQGERFSYPLIAESIHQHLNILRGRGSRVDYFQYDYRAKAPVAKAMCVLNGVNFNALKFNHFGIHPRPLLVAHDGVGVLCRNNGISGLVEAFFTLADGGDKEQDATAANQHTHDRNAQQQHRPISHILLGLQILIGGLILIVGFKIISYALPKLIDAKIAAGLGYFYGGLGAIIFGILLISGIGLMY